MSRFIDTETFLAVAEAGTLSGAARALGVDKSVASRRLSALEARLGATLLNRSTRGLTLTDAGRSYRDRARVLLRDWREMEEEAGGAEAALAGPIRLSAPLSFGLAYLGPALADFRILHPDVRLDVDFSDRQADLVAERMDLAVRVGRLADSALIARSLGEVELIPVCAPAFLHGYGPVAHPDDLAAAPELRFSLRGATGFDWTGPNGTAGRLQMEAVMRATNGDFLRDAAVRGLGVTVQPDFILCDAVRDGRLLRLLPDYRFDRLGVHALYSPNRHLPRRVRALIDFLVARFAGEPPWSLAGSGPAAGDGD